MVLGVLSTKVEGLLKSSLDLINNINEIQFYLKKSIPMYTYL